MQVIFNAGLVNTHSHTVWFFIRKIKERHVPTLASSPFDPFSSNETAKAGSQVGDVLLPVLAVKSPAEELSLRYYYGDVLRALFV